MILPICGAVLCYYVWLYTTLPISSAYHSPGEVPEGWEVPPTHFAVDSSDGDSDGDPEKGKASLQELGKGRHIKSGRSWSYKDYRKAKEGSMSQASGSERKGSGGARRGNAGPQGYRRV